MKKGIFWIKNYESRNPEIIAVTIDCDLKGNVTDGNLIKRLIRLPVCFYLDHEK